MAEPPLDPLGLTLDFTSVGPDAGGVGVVAVGVARGLIDTGTAFDCVVSSAQLEDWRAQLPELGARLRPVNVALAATSSWQQTLRRVLPKSTLSQRAISVVRSVRARSTRSALGEGLTWLPFHRVPLAASRGVVTVHDLRVFEPELASPMDQRIIESNVREARAVVCSWPHPYQALLSRFPEARGKAFVIPLPVLNPGRPTARSAPGATATRLLFPGFITPHKNHQVLIRALPLLPDSIAVFTGSEDGTHGDHLRELAERLGVADRIEWKGFVSAAELEEEYANAHILVMPTRWEAASGPVYEAIARELPFVASEIAPIRAQLDSLGLDAETFAWDSPEALAEAVSRTVEHYDVQVERIRRASQAVRERTWSQTAAEYRRVFEWAAGLGDRPDDLMIG